MFLKDSWLTTLRASVRSCLRDIGKGWFNLEETNWEVYRMSKISKLMESVRFMMQVRFDRQTIVNAIPLFYLFPTVHPNVNSSVPRSNVY